MDIINTTAIAATAEQQNLMAFALSDYFLWFWVLVGVAIIFVPFGFNGMFSLWKWIDKNWLKPKRGFILVRQKMPNDRIREFWTLPTGQYMKYKSLDTGTEIEQPVKLEKGWVAYEGNVPMIELDENGTQMMMDSSRKTVSPISQEEITRGYKSAYESGKLVGNFDLLRDMKTMMIIFIVVVAAVGGIGAYFSYQAWQVSLDANDRISGMPQTVFSMMENITKGGVPMVS